MLPGEREPISPGSCNCMHSARGSKGYANESESLSFPLKAKGRSLRLQAEHADDAAGAQVILLRGKILLEFFRPSI
jgi:hypothetical protein